MQYIFQIFVIVEVFSLRVPMPGSDSFLKLTYPLQAALVLLLIAQFFSSKRQSASGSHATSLALLQTSLLLAVSIPFLFSGPPSATTAGYTLVLASWVATSWLLLNNFSISLRSFVRTYLVAIYLLLTLSLLYSLSLGDQRIDSIFGGGTNRLGLYSVIGALVTLYILGKKLDSGMQLIYRVGLVICVAGIVFTFSRSAILALSVAALEHAIRNQSISLKQAGLFGVILISSVVFLDHMYVTTQDERFLKLMYRFGINEFLGHPYFENVGEVSRFVHYQNAMSLITENTRSLVFGLGLESYRSTEFLSNNRGEDLTLHSMYLQYLMGGGILALLCLITFIGTLYVSILKFVTWQKDILLFILIPSIVHAAFLPAIFSREILIYIPLLIVSCQLKNSAKRVNNRRVRREKLGNVLSNN